jgi:hypothetical protein
MIDITKLSSRYTVRILEDSDIDDIVELCRQNTIFYKYTEARPTRENIQEDMKVTPPLSHNLYMINLVIKMIMRFLCRKGYKNGEGFGYGRYRHGCQLGVRVRGL